MYKPYIWKSAAELPVSADLPDPFLKPDGTRVKCPGEWPEQREYLKSMLQHYLYGSLPPTPGNTTGRVISSEMIYDGKALRDTVEVKCGPDHKIVFSIDVVRPNKPGRYPVVVLNTFSTRNFSPEMIKAFGISPSSKSGLISSPIEEEAVCSRNYCIALYDCTQLATDAPSSKGPIYDAYPDLKLKAVAAWAWGQMRAIDYLEATEYADMGKIIATGHSRYGKVALCTGIFDERVALCAPMGSGCGGAGCFRILGGKSGPGSGYQERLGSAVTMFPHWFSDNIREFCSADCSGLDDLRKGFAANAKGSNMDMSAFNRYITERYPLKDEGKLPFDLHTAKALVAPRLLLTSDGLDDEWANPYGTQVTWTASGEVFKFLGAEGSNAAHFREGGHSFSVEDWTVLLDFADNKLKGIQKPYAYPINNTVF